MRFEAIVMLDQRTYRNRMLLRHGGSHFPHRRQPCSAPQPHTPSPSSLPSSLPWPGRQLSPRGDQCCHAGMLRGSAREEKRPIDPIRKLVGDAGFMGIAYILVSHVES